MTSALMILFLGCWLAGQSRVSGGGTNLTQPGTAPAPTHPGNTGPGTESGDRKSPSTLTETEGTNPAGTQQPDPPMTKPEGEGETDLTQPGMTPAPTQPGSAGPGIRDGGRKSPSTPPETRGTDPVQPGAVPAPTCPDSADPGGSESPMPAPMPAPPDLPCPIVFGMSIAAAVLLLLLLVAFICFRKTRAIQRSNEDLLSAEQFQQQ